MKPRTFEEAVLLYEKMIKKQMKTLRIYRDFEEYYQCGLVALWRAYERFEEGKGTFSAYAFLTVRGHLLVELEKNSRLENRHTYLEPSVLAQLVYEEEYDSFSSHLHGLNEKQRFVVMQRVYYGTAMTEIAKEMGLTYEQVRFLYKGAICELRKRYI